MYGTCPFFVIQNTMDRKPEICAACGRRGANLKTCNACKHVKYCSRECQLTHRSEHKTECKKRARLLKEEKVNDLVMKLYKLLSDSQEKMKDIDLFGPLPPKDDCPICMDPLPIDASHSTYFACCGKLICNGCSHASDVQVAKVNRKRAKNKQTLLPFPCAFCRKPTSQDSERLSNVKKRLEMNDAIAYREIATYYDAGKFGAEQDSVKALEFYMKAAELGLAKAFNDISIFSAEGKIVPKRPRTQRDFLIIAAKKGHILGRHILGYGEYKYGKNDELAIKHWKISASAGYQESLDMIKLAYQNKCISKGEFTQVLQSFRDSRTAEKNDLRDAFIKDEESGELENLGITYNY